MAKTLQSWLDIENNNSYEFWKITEIFKSNDNSINKNARLPALMTGNRTLETSDSTDSYSDCLNKHIILTKRNTNIFTSAEK